MTGTGFVSFFLRAARCALSLSVLGSLPVLAQCPEEG